MFSCLDVWLEWIEDEQSEFTSNGQKLTQGSFDRIQLLFQKATSDYLSVNLWLKWADWMELMVVESLEAAQSSDRQDPPRVSFEDVRAFYEVAVENLADHMSRGHEIWARYRAFEDLAASVSEDSESVPIVVRKRSLFHRELAHPNKGLQEMFDTEYLPWEQAVGEVKSPMKEESKEQIKRLLDATKEEYRRRAEHEATLYAVEMAFEENHTPDYTKLDALRKYLKYELSHATSSHRVSCLFERILAMYFLVLDIWQLYSQNLIKAPSKWSRVQKLEQALNVQRRAVRNYPYTHHMWTQLMLTLEQYAHEMPEGDNKRDDIRLEVTTTFERALQGGLQSGVELLLVYKQYLDYRIRAVTDWSDEAQLSTVVSLLDAARTYFESFLPDLTFEMELYWATMALVRIGSADQARDVYELSVKRDPSSTRAWIAFINFELHSQSSVDNAREIYKRSYHIPTLDSAETIWSAWLDFERSYGTLETYLYALEKIEKKQRDLAVKQAAAAAQLAEHDELGPRKKNAKSGSRRNETDNSRGRSNNDARHRGEVPSPRKSNVQGDTRAPSAKKFAKDAEGSAVQTNNRKAEQESFPRKTGAHQQTPRASTPNFDPITLHVAGLPSSPELAAAITKEDIASIFESYGAVADVRFPLNDMGQRKGFVFVQFAEAAAAKAVRVAVKHEKKAFVLNLAHGTSTQSFPLRVTAAVALKPHKPKSSSSKKPVEGLEEYKHTVFVSGLSALTTLPKLEAFLSKSSAPAPTAIRMPTDRKTGASRCIAYLDFEDPQQVLEATEKLNGQLLDGRKVKAAPSAPTKERAPHNPNAMNTADALHAPPVGVGALGGKAAQEAAKHAESLPSQPKLVPRSVAMRKPTTGAPKPRVAVSSSSAMDTS